MFLRISFKRDSLVSKLFPAILLPIIELKDLRGKLTYNNCFNLSKKIEKKKKVTSSISVESNLTSKASSISSSTNKPLFRARSYPNTPKAPE